MEQGEETAGGGSEMTELTQRGLALYDAKIKAILEPEYNNQFVAIEPDSESYLVARSSGNAMRAMHRRYPDRLMVLMRIGPEPEYGLAARILAGEMQEGRRK